MPHSLRRWLRLAAGLLAGAVTALAELLLTIAAGPWLIATPARPRTGRPRTDHTRARRPRARRPLYAASARLTRLEQRRMHAFYGTPPAGPAAGPAAGPRTLRYVAARWAVGLLGGLVLGTAAVGALYTSTLLWVWFLPDLNYPLTAAGSGLAGIFLLFLAAQAVYGVAALDASTARRFLGPSHESLLHHRIGELAATRAGVVEAVNDERRRIERDLHDGVQQRLVVLGMLIGRARRAGDRDPAKAAELLRQAHEESRQALTELREVAWRVYPTSLDEEGLRAALETVAERSTLPVDVAYELTQPLPEAQRTVAYFVASEAVTNAIKHSGAARITIRLTTHEAEDIARLTVTDDGHGGADPAAGGLTGLARRVAALDGRFAVDSPPGGPTTITAELPCA
ncbi:sensor histidine kinase [Streptomyces boninensis]|uniref:sensor histidine kinase n=1 Tax=Streptomyces boninensis TaxID=2039455 RepID=UPI003B21E6D5